uniref:MTHFR SAM-binding regulatory domain-containing protein n=1 Tax=Vitis vinifera TaxID=29760 RepID=F6HAZ6_VITVI
MDLHTKRKVNLLYLMHSCNPSYGALIDYQRVGWGGAGGYVYQKANAELFCTNEKLNGLTEKCKAFPSLTYMAMNKEGAWMSN